MYPLRSDNRMQRVDLKERNRIKGCSTCLGTRVRRTTLTRKDAKNEISKEGREEISRTKSEKVATVGFDRKNDTIVRDERHERHRDFFLWKDNRGGTTPGEELPINDPQSRFMKVISSSCWDDTRTI